GDAPPRRGAAGAAPPAGASRRRGGRRRPQRLPRGSVEPPPGNAAELPADRLRNGDGGTGGDPPAERAPPDDHRPDLPRARPGAVAMGPRDAHRLDDRRRRRLARAPVPRAARRLLRGDGPDRPGVRDPRVTAARGPRRLRSVRRGGTRVGRADPRRRDRPGAGPGRAPPAARPGDPRPRRGPARRLLVDPVARGRAIAADRARGVRAALGPARAERGGVAGHVLAGLAPAPSGDLPP